MVRGFVVFSVIPLGISCAAQGLCLGGVALGGAPSLFCCCAVASCALTVFLRNISPGGLHCRSALFVVWRLWLFSVCFFSAVLAVSFHRKWVRFVFRENVLFYPDYYFRTATATF